MPVKKTEVVIKQDNFFSILPTQDIIPRHTRKPTQTTVDERREMHGFRPVFRHVLTEEEKAKLIEAEVK